MNVNRKQLSQTKRWVIKIGSSLVTNKGQGLDNQAIQAWSEQMRRLQQSGVECLLVSSGAVAEGMARLGWTQRPHAIHELQAAAAVGQMGLVQAYETCFRQHDIHTAQILLTHDDLSNRERYLNARITLKTLLSLGTIPIINENDTVATDEIRFGDNDTLAALVANLVEADTLIILTDQQGLYDKAPELEGARLVEQAEANEPGLTAMAGPSAGTLGMGGMSTKITAAQRAARSGCSTVIASGAEENVLLRLRDAENIGTLLTPSTEPLTARKQWLAGHLRPRGTVTLDSGASRVLQASGGSLLAVGVTAVSGQFLRGDLISCIDTNGNEVARGLVNYSASESLKIKGLASHEIEKTLGYVDEEELIHRDNLVLIN
ncbi:MAG: glutamate 5-kinase [Gammaproteobacteria bacterium]|nr:glutamate 5-kinase [Gammaproteobacteria bacterium]